MNTCFSPITAGFCGPNCSPFCVPGVDCLTGWNAQGRFPQFGGAWTAPQNFGPQGWNGFGGSPFNAFGSFNAGNSFGWNTPFSGAPTNFGWNTPFNGAPTNFGWNTPFNGWNPSMNAGGAWGNQFAAASAGFNPSWNPTSWNQTPWNQTPWNQGSWNQAPWGQSPWGQGFNPAWGAMSGWNTPWAWNTPFMGFPFFGMPQGTPAGKGKKGETEGAANGCYPYPFAFGPFGCFNPAAFCPPCENNRTAA